MKEKSVEIYPKLTVGGRVIGFFFLLLSVFSNIYAIVADYLFKMQKK